MGFYGGNNEYQKFFFRLFSVWITFRLDKIKAGNSK